ncbi:MAG: LysE family translocator [Deferribacterales bacterium]
MESLSYWLLFFSAAFALCVSPGPDLLYILSQTIAKGTKAGLASMLGVCSGAMVHVTMAALGLSAIMAASAVAFTAVKLVGAVYLIYLGIKAFRSKTGDVHFKQGHDSSITFFKAYKQGILIDIFNPKPAIFFMAFLPQFVRVELGHTSAQLFVLGTLVVMVGLLVEAVVVFTAGNTTAFFRGNRRMSGLLNKALGSVMIYLGVRLALIHNK